MNRDNSSSETELVASSEPTKTGAGEADLREYRRRRRAWGPSSSGRSWLRWTRSRPRPARAPWCCRTSPPAARRAHAIASERVRCVARRDSDAAWSITPQSIGMKRLASETRGKEARRGPERIAARMESPPSPKREREIFGEARSSSSRRKIPVVARRTCWPADREIGRPPWLHHGLMWAVELC